MMFSLTKKNKNIFEGNESIIMIRYIWRQIHSKASICIARVLSDTETLSDIFFHSDLVKLFNTFFTKLIKDSTYKTNKYWVPLLEHKALAYSENLLVLNMSSKSMFFSHNWCLALNDHELNNKKNLIKCICLRGNFFFFLVFMLVYYLKFQFMFLKFSK
jgi:hypothetical protein